MQEKILAKKRKLNMKLYPVYTMLAADSLFFNAIKVLFLTQVKEISNANVVLMETIYAFFKMIIQIPMTIVVSKLGTRKSVILGNIFWILEAVLILISRNYAMIILSQFLSAIGWSFKSISEQPLLKESIPESSTQGKIFTKLYGKGYSIYCYISAITTIMSGFLYEINPYIPVVCMILCMLLGLTISFNFLDVKQTEEKTIKKSIIDVKEGLEFILKSPRLKSLLLMLGFMWGMFCVFGTYQTTLLKDINVPARYIGIILAILEIIQGKSSTKADEFNNKHKNKTLTYMSLRMTLGIMLAGGVVIIALPKIPELTIIFITYIITNSDKGIYKTIKGRYMGSFVKANTLTKIYSVYSVLASACRMLIGAIGTYLLTIMNIEYAMLTIGIIFAIVTIIFSIYMKTRLGLRPEQYTKRDVEYIS